MKGSCRCRRSPHALRISGKALRCRERQGDEASSGGSNPVRAAETTGLSTKPTRGEPWLMDAGRPGAHGLTPPANDMVAGNCERQNRKDVKPG